MPKQKRKRFIFILLTLLMLGLVSHYYVNKFLLPEKFKTVVENRLKDYLKRDVSIGKIQYTLLKGFSLQDIKVFRKDDTTKPFVQIKETSFNILITPFFKKKQIIIPSITINFPYIFINRAANNQFNFFDLLNANENSSNYQYIIKKLIVENAQLDYIDQGGKNEIYESLRNINLEISASLDKKIPFHLFFKIPSYNSSFQASGTYDIESRSLLSKVNLKNIFIAKYLSPFLKNSLKINNTYITTANLDASLLNANLSLKGDASLSNIETQVGNTNISASQVNLSNIFLSSIEKKWNLKTLIQSPQFKITLSNKENISGALKANIHSLNFFEQNISLQSDIDLNETTYLIDTKKKISGNLKANNLFFKKTAENINIKTDCAINQVNIVFNNFFFSSNASMTQMNLTLKDKDLHITSNLTLNGFETEIENKKAQGSLKTSYLELQKNTEGLSIKTNAKYDQAEILFNDIIFTGAPTLSASYSFNNENVPSHTYNINAIFSDSQILNAPLFNSLNSIHGEITLKPNFFKIKNLNLKDKETNLILNGKFENFENLTTDLTLNATNLNLLVVSDILKSQLAKFDITLEGTSDAILIYKGFLKTPTEAIIKVDSILKSVILKSSKIPLPLTSITGELNYEKDLLTWKNLNFQYNTLPFLIDGQLENFSRPAVITTITSDNLKASTIFKILRKSLNIESIKGNYYQTLFDLTGDLNFLEKQQPEISVKGTTTIHLTDLEKIFPKQKELFNKLTPTGRLDGDIIYRGQINNWKDWTLMFDLESEKVVLNNYTLMQPTLKFGLRDRYISDCHVNGYFYDGLLDFALTTDLSKVDLPMNSTITIDNLNLGKFRKAQNFLKKEFNGNLSLTTNIAGPLNDLYKSSGSGSFAVSDGYLWKVIPQYDGITFTAAKGDFTINASRIYTNNAELISRAIILRGTGWIDFAKKIHMNITPIPIGVTAIKSGSITIDATSLIAQVASINCYGTLNKPDCTAKVSPFKVFKNTKDILQEGTGIITEGLGSILEDLF